MKFSIADIVLMMGATVPLLLGACLAGESLPAKPACDGKTATPTSPSLTTLDSAGKAVSPSSAEVEEHLRKLETDHPKLVKLEVPQKTCEGRPIYAVTISDPGVPDHDKQQVLIVAGQHGNEESGRMVALALLDWLLSREGATTLRKQKIAIMPNVNPDGAERDMHETPAGIQPNLDHGPQGARSPEGKAVEAVSYALQPELFVDMHARGGAGCSYDMVLYPMTLTYQEDDNLLHQIAAEMAKAGEEAGIPHVTHSLTWPGWGNNDINDVSTTVFHYRNFHSLVFLTETAEHNDHAHPVAARVAVGLARLKVLLEYGNRRHARFYYEGYPCGHIGMNPAALVPVGRTAAERRASRVALWTHRDSFSSLKPALPEQAKDKTCTFTCRSDHVSPLGLQVRCAGKMQVETILLDGRRLAVSEIEGYYAWQDICSTLVVVAQPSWRAGEHTVRIQLK
ncbi:MAG: M14 family zinc carboxypeptidase [Thermoguttaceae bacterium]|jgi:hypothetical protein